MTTKGKTKEKTKGRGNRKVGPGYRPTGPAGDVGAPPTSGSGVAGGKGDGVVRVRPARAPYLGKDDELRLHLEHWRGCTSIKALREACRTFEAHSLLAGRVANDRLDSVEALAKRLDVGLIDVRADIAAVSSKVFDDGKRVDRVVKRQEELDGAVGALQRKRAFDAGRIDDVAYACGRLEAQMSQMSQQKRTREDDLTIREHDAGCLDDVRKDCAAMTSRLVRVGKLAAVEHNKRVVFGPVPDEGPLRPEDRAPDPSVMVPSELIEAAGGEDEAREVLRKHAKGQETVEERLRSMAGALGTLTGRMSALERDDAESVARLRSEVDALDNAAVTLQERLHALEGRVTCAEVDWSQEEQVRRLDTIEGRVACVSGAGTDERRELRQRLDALETRVAGIAGAEAGGREGQRRRLDDIEARLNKVRPVEMFEGMPCCPTCGVVTCCQNEDCTDEENKIRGRVPDESKVHALLDVHNIKGGQLLERVSDLVNRYANAKADILEWEQGVRVRDDKGMQETPAPVTVWVGLGNAGYVEGELAEARRGLTQAIDALGIAARVQASKKGD